jgi:hypothetical protein
VHEFESPGRPPDLELVELYWCPERLVQHALTWCDYEHYQEKQDSKAKDLKRKSRQPSDFLWTPMQSAWSA